MIKLDLEGVENSSYLPRRVYIFDTTLRDGEQTPGVSFTVEEKLLIARQLDRLGVDIIEAGFPITSRGEEKAVRRIAREGLEARICALARPVRGDIDKALGCDINYLHIFIATSDLHLRHKLMMTREEVRGCLIEGVEYAKEHGVTVEFSPEDATRTELGFLKEICKTAVEAGADKVDIPDTVGVMTPRRFYRLVREIKEAVDVPISVHCHDDFGLATANSLAAIEAGAEQVHVCVNGLGERAGNASLEEVVVNLIAHYGVELRIDPKRIAETSELVERLSGIQLPPNTPIVGENAFTHESGIHVHGILGHPKTYEALTPEFVGKHRRIIVGKHTGRHAVRATLEEMGLRPSEEQLNIIVEEVKRLGDMGKRVTEADLYAIAANVMDRRVEDRVKVKQLVVVTGNTITPTASATLLVDGDEVVTSSMGNGPIDAAVNAIRSAVEGFADIKLERFYVRAITGGTDAIADVTVTLRRGDRVITAGGVSGDIVMASVEAILKGMNRLLDEVERHGEDGGGEDPQ